MFYFFLSFFPPSFLPPSPSFFTGLHLWHMEVPGLEVESEMQQQAYTTATAILDLTASVTYTIAHGNTGSLNPLSKTRDPTHILMDTSWVVSTEPQGELACSIIYGLLTMFIVSVCPAKM